MEHKKVTCFFKDAEKVRVTAAGQESLYLPAYLRVTPIRWLLDTQLYLNGLQALAGRANSIFSASTLLATMGGRYSQLLPWGMRPGKKTLARRPDFLRSYFFL